MRRLLQWWRQHRLAYQPVVQVTLFKEHLLHNLKTYQALWSNIPVAPVLKSNAYGHGLVPIAQILDPLGLPYLIIDSYHEALILRRAGITTPLLLIGYTPVENIIHNRLADITFTVVSNDQAKIISRQILRPTAIHLKIDTGMHRQGIALEDLESLWQELTSNQAITITGVCSHLADADGLDPAFTHQQIQQWNTIVEHIKQWSNTVQYFHLSNSAGVAYRTDMKCTMVRLGLGLYGINPQPQRPLDLRPVLRLSTVVSGIKSVQPGDHIGYNCTYTATQPGEIATIPVGYYEGVDRRLSNAGQVLVHGQSCPIVGRVSMNITTIDVTTVPAASINDEVIVLSEDPTAPNSIENLAKICKTIPYELLVHVPQQLRRVVK